MKRFLTVAILSGLGVLAVAGVVLTFIGFRVGPPLPDPTARIIIGKKVAPFQAQNPRVDRIRISVFGFSGGATEARVFCNWLGEACDPGPGPLRLCGIPVQIDFVGLFDTVASVGAAQSYFESVFDSHGVPHNPRCS